jgi:CheY-like chemotaxis protein
MNDELLSLRAVVVSNVLEDHDVFRQALAAIPVPIDVVTVEGAAAAGEELRLGADLLYVDSGLSEAEVAGCIAAARAAPSPPFSVLLTLEKGSALRFETDALAARPIRPDAIKRFIERSVRVRLPTRVLVVDDSATTRAIVRKLLAGTRLPLEVSEADEGFAALKIVRERAIDLVFLDYNMPGFSGLETIAEFKREKRRAQVVLMTAMEDETLADRARELNAAFLKKPFYPADIDAVLCRFYGLRALNLRRK